MSQKKSSNLKFKSSQKITSFLNLIIIFVCGFLIGQIRSLYLDYNRSKAVYIDQSYKPEVALVEMKKIVGDELYFSITGNARVIWGENFRDITQKSSDRLKIAENQKTNNNLKNSLNNQFTLPLGQIPREQDLELKNFKYLGNAKTKKFYPTSSYPARGTEYKYRRFFQTKEEALSAGFIASKLVK